MLQSVPVIFPFNCLVMWWLGILSDTWSLPPHHSFNSPSCSSSLHPSCFILLPPPLGLSNNQCSNNMSRGKERRRSGKARSGWWLVILGFWSQNLGLFFFFPWRAWDSYRSCGWIRRKLVPVGEVVTDGFQVINWDNNRRWRENKGSEYKLQLLVAKGLSLFCQEKSRLGMFLGKRTVAGMGRGGWRW